MSTIELKYNPDSGFWCVYIDGEPVLTFKEDEDLVSTLKDLGKLLGFKVKYKGELTDEEVESLI